MVQCAADLTRGLAAVHGSGGIVKWLVSDDPGSLALTADQMGQLLHHNMPYEEFKRMLEHRQ